MEYTFRHDQGKIKRLLAIHIPVMELKASVIWYTGHFGLTLLQLNGSTAEMMHASNLEGLRDKMVDAGANVTLPHADQEDDGCGRFFEATDPSGNIIQIQANDEELPADHTRVEAIFNLEIPVSDVRKSALFYADVLGFQLIREPDDQLAIVKTGPFYKCRFGYFDVQEFGFFLFRHEGRTALHFKDAVGRVQECLVLQAYDTAALHEHLTGKGHMVMGMTSITDFGQMSFQIVDPDGNRIKVVPQRINKQLRDSVPISRSVRNIGKKIEI